MPQKQYLIPVVLSGDVASVDSIVDQVSKAECTVDQSDEAYTSNAKQKTKAKAKDKGSAFEKSSTNDSEDCMSPPKKMKILNLNTDPNCHPVECEASVVASGVLRQLPSIEEEKPNVDEEVPELIVKSSPQDAAEGDGVASQCGLGVLYEAAVQNSNILHVCGQLESVSEGGRLCC